MPRPAVRKTTRGDRGLDGGFGNGPGNACFSRLSGRSPSALWKQTPLPALATWRRRGGGALEAAWTTPSSTPRLLQVWHCQEKRERTEQNCWEPHPPPRPPAFASVPEKVAAFR